MKNIWILTFIFVSESFGEFGMNPWAQRKPNLVDGQQKSGEYIPMFSRFTPFSTEESIPGPIYGRIPSNYRPESRPPYDRRENPESFEFRPGPEPFSGPQGETEENRPPFLSSYLKGRRIPGPEYLEQNTPFFGPIPAAKSRSNVKIEQTLSPTVNSESQASKGPKNKALAPQYGSEIRIPTGKSRPDRLFVINPPEFPIISSPPPYPFFGTQTPKISLNQLQKQSYISTTSPSVQLNTNYIVKNPSLYSPLQGPFPSNSSPENRGQSTVKPRSLPLSFRNFFPPGFGPFSENQSQ